jgi:nicotinamidase-related amidase
VWTPLDGWIRRAAIAWPQGAGLLAQSRDISYDIRAAIGDIADKVKPLEGEPVIVKNYPNAFLQTALHERLQKLGVTNLVLGGFMTHMCVNSTARGAFILR